MNLVLCMAGLYQRFRQAGYMTPKFLLPWRGRTILEHILDSMLESGAFHRPLLVANRRDQSHAPALLAALRRHNAENLLFVKDTRGQAETALVAARHLVQHFHAASEAIVFHNIDTILCQRDYRAMAEDLKSYDGYIDVFLSGSSRYSYVSVTPDLVVTAMAEKQVISPYASSGLYGFRSAAEYILWAERSTYAGEFYISDVYRSLIREGGRVKIGRPSVEQETIVLGTPEEYESGRRAA